MRRFFRKIKLKHIFYTLLVALILMLAFLLFFGFLYAPSKIEGASMEDTIFDGDWLLIKKTGIDTEKLQRGDIIIIKGEPKRYTLLKFLNNSEIAKRFVPSPIGEDWIKRIIAVGGDVVDLQKDSIYVNGVRLIEPYLKDRNTTYDRHLFDFPMTVPEGEFFVMGDNRLKSHDSRNIGTIRADEIVGTSNFRLLPFSRFGKFY